jgi:hypothetical protein
LDASSVKSFTILPDPIFPNLPTMKVFQLRLLDIVLKAQGIGVVPTNRIIAGLVVIAIIWVAIAYFTAHKKEIPRVFVTVVNPYQAYLNELSSPSPVSEIKWVTTQAARLYSIPGWTPVSLTYSENEMKAQVRSSGAKVSMLYGWLEENNAKLQITDQGIFVSMPIVVAKRSTDLTISPLQDVIAELLDRLSNVMPGNSLKLGAIVNHGQFFETELTVNFNDISLETLDLLGEQFSGLPLVLVKLTLTINNGMINGSITLNALGS